MVIEVEGGGVISGWYCNVELLTAEQLTLLVIDYDWLHPVGLVFTIRGDRRGGGGGRGGGGTGGEERGDRRRGGGAQEGRRGTEGDTGGEEGDTRGGGNRREGHFLLNIS